MINGSLEYSKLETGGFPDFHSVVKAVESTVRGEKNIILKSQSATCNIL